MSNPTLLISELDCDWQRNWRYHFTPMIKPGSLLWRHLTLLWHSASKMYCHTESSISWSRTNICVNSLTASSSYMTLPLHIQPMWWEVPKYLTCSLELRLCNFHVEPWKDAHGGHMFMSQWHAGDYGILVRQQLKEFFPGGICMLNTNWNFCMWTCVISRDHTIILWHLYTANYL
jgi:hypothetical protein